MFEGPSSSSSESHSGLLPSKHWPLRRKGSEVSTFPSSPRPNTLRIRLEGGNYPAVDLLLSFPGEAEMEEWRRCVESAVKVSKEPLGEKKNDIGFPPPVFKGCETMSAEEEEEVSDAGPKIVHHHYYSGFLFLAWEEGGGEGEGGGEAGGGGHRRCESPNSTRNGKSLALISYGRGGGRSVLRGSELGRVLDISSTPVRLGDMGRGRRRIEVVRTFPSPLFCP